MKLKKKIMRGQALVIIVLALTAIMGTTALAVDGGNIYLERRKMQNAADSAALAGALSRLRDGGVAWVNVAFDAAAQNGYNNNGTTNTVNVYSPPISGHNVGDIEYIQIVIDSTISTYFAGAVGVSTVDNHVEAITRTTMPKFAELLKGLAVVSLAPVSNCTNRRAFDVSGQATLEVHGGGVFSNSNNPTCAMTTYGNGSIRVVDPGFGISVVGGAAIQKPQLVSPFPPGTNSIPISYPPPFILPKLSCKGPAKILENDPTSISPGYWDGDFPPEGVTGMQPGLYCINDDFIVKSGTILSGSGVTILLEHGKLKIESGVQINLEAPLNGDHSGLLIYAPQDNHNAILLNGNAESTFRGTILSLGGTIHLKGSDFLGYGFHSQLIGYYIMADGDSKYIIKYLEDQNYHAIGMPQVQLVK